jgi:hypothetical protein
MRHAASQYGGPTNGSQDGVVQQASILSTPQVLKDPWKYEFAMHENVTTGNENNTTEVIFR